jgi:hypothetical protein
MAETIEPVRPAPKFGGLCVTFRKKFRQYNGGEIAGFDPVFAGRLVASGAARWATESDMKKAKTFGVDTLPVSDATGMELAAMAKELADEQTRVLEEKAAADLAERDARIAELEAQLAKKKK